MAWKYVIPPSLLMFAVLLPCISSYDDRCPPNLSSHVDVFECQCYEFKKSEGSWNNEQCSKNGGHLAKITKKATNDYLESKMREVYGNDVAGVWIGAKRTHDEGPWLWSDGTKVEYTSWASGEPDNLFDVVDQNCAYMKRTRFWSWASLQCSGLGSSIPSVCQYDIAGCALDQSEEKFTTAILIGIVMGSIVGAIIVCLLICCLVVRCKTACINYRKKQRQRRSVRYYSRPPSSSQRSTEPQCVVETDGNAAGENDLNESLLTGAGGLTDSPPMKVKGSALPTAATIAAEASGGLVVDVHTGKATIKRVNGPSTSNGAGPSKTPVDDISTRSLRSFNVDTDSKLSHDQVSHPVSADEHSLSSSLEDNSVLANLDNVDKPFSNTSKTINY